MSSSKASCTPGSKIAKLRRSSVWSVFRRLGVPSQKAFGALGTKRLPDFFCGGGLFAKTEE